jgi:hypothetical protein
MDVKIQRRSPIPRTLRLSIALLLGLTTLGLGGARGDEHTQGPQRTLDNFVRPFVTQYCARCHGGPEPKADLRLDAVDAIHPVRDHRDRWETIAEMVRLGEMPPAEEPQPSDEAKGHLVGWIEWELTVAHGTSRPDPGRVTIRRLNRTEYNNTIRDLLGVDFEPADDFPADDIGHGFDNMGDVLSLSPILMEKYLDAAEQIVTRAMGRPETRDRIITSLPSETRTPQQAAREVLAALAYRAFRRPVADEELERLLGLVKLAQDSGADYRESVRFGIQAVLVSPYFLFRIELDADPQEVPAPRRLNDYELATRLSYFLWSSMPDGELFALAEKGQLGDTEVLVGQVRRMLVEVKAKALVEDFAGQWLQLRELDKVTPDPGRYPVFDSALRDAMRRETEQFLENLIREDRSILELIDSDYTFVNERLARHYGIPDVAGEEFRRVKLEDPRRGGVLSQASVLTLTSNPTRTSPVKRGKWILENILGTPPPPPPAGVEELAEDEAAELLGTLRERMEQHRSDPTCAVCHRKMDALGFGLENYDGVGAWRDKDGRFQIDASGTLPPNRTFDGPKELRTILRTTQKSRFTRCMAEKMLTYALGRGLTPYDRGAVNDIVTEVEKNDYRFSSLVIAIVQSDPFRMRGSPGAEK